MPADPNIVELVDDAKLLASYFRKIGDQRSGELLTRVSAIEKAGINRVSMGDPNVVQLNALFTSFVSTLPAGAVLNLRSSGGIFVKIDRKKSVWLATLVLASIFFMFVVGQLTHIYNRGVDLAADLAALEAQKPLQKFGILERNLLYAEARLEDGSSANITTAATGDKPGKSINSAAVMKGIISPPSDPVDNQYRLAQEASQQYVAELTELDQKINALEAETRDFQKQATYPFMGMETMSSWLNRTSTRWACLLLQRPVQLVAAASGAPKDAGKVTTRSRSNCDSLPQASNGYGYSPRFVGMRNTFCNDIGRFENGSSEAIDNLPPIIKASLEDRFGIDVMKVIDLNCKLGLNYYSDSVPFISVLSKPVSSIISFYSFMVLPCLFGAFGALMYYMRRVLDPRAVDPSLTRTLHRVALGALSGMILAWLWNGMFNANEDFRAVGLGVFALAFVFGFSIDVFFVFLDRLVRLSTDAVNRIGA
ncbi:hypothetical protein SAMN04488498_1062 [Mesorhizobium albiziae]|uniref:Uncharacterized protein n=2 Tax=Neomesorhizobium albiziae TaxID=335020 RepID=A0A1I3Z7Z3_9HYPH|nr:hypothetical protein GCM10007937_37670 [Mesorhizobium albiziae]SFK40142.1 hypothetical protein SAMN04488498_1062 [Mesorhizobium albiziae]